MTEAAPQRKSMYSMGTAANMVRSLIVIAALMVIVFLISPRPNQSKKEDVDLMPGAVAAATSSRMPLEMPTGASGWAGRRAGIGPSTDQVVTFTAVYATPSGKDAMLLEARGVTDTWLSKAVNGGDKGAERQIGSRTWVEYTAPAKGQVSLALKPAAKDGLTIVATSSGSMDELAQMVGTLKPVEVAPSGSATGR